jgi:hypothetical protein
MHTAIAWAALAYVYTQLTTHTAPEPQHDTHTRLWLRPQGLILDQGPSRSWPRSPLLPSGGRTPQISPKPRHPPPIRGWKPARRRYACLFLRTSFSFPSFPCSWLGDLFHSLYFPCSWWCAQPDRSAWCATRQNLPAGWAAAVGRLAGPRRRGPCRTTPATMEVDGSCSTSSDERVPSMAPRPRSTQPWPSWPAGLIADAGRSTWTTSTA